MMVAVNAHRRLVAWECCMELTREVYSATGRFPAQERYGLASQLRRAAVSTAANIAEGYARYGRQELAHALSVSLGSLAEVDALLEIASQLGYLSSVEHQRLSALREQASRTTFGLQRKVRR
jgi:four helix bundle protein